VLGPHGHAFNGAYSADAAATYAKVAIFISSAIGIVLGDRWLAQCAATRSSNTPCW
jgi:NADH-quinone oxidoreductase subunit N